MPSTTTVHWVVQTDLGPSVGVDEVCAAIEAQGLGLTKLTRHPPMATEPPVLALPRDVPIMVYGTTNLVEQLAHHRPWAPGVFFEPANFTYTAWAEHYGAHLLNDPKDTHQVTVAQALEQRDQLAAFTASDIFVRPEHDLKAFNGAVWTPVDFLAWAHQAADGKVPQVGPNTPIVIAPAHGIAAEWRLVVTDQGEVIASSQYRAKGRLKVQADTPTEVIEFAQARALQWSPAAVFVLDVARSGEGLYVVEAQCAHCAGFYAMDVNAWVRGMSDVARRAYSHVQDVDPALPLVKPRRPG